MRPLYKTLAEKPLSLSDGHAGLWYEKFCDKWNGDWRFEPENGNPKLEWIKTVCEEKIGKPELLGEFVERTKQLVKAKRGKCGIFRATSRFVTGLGRSHPVENGFAWHPTLGVPYLPGSSIKGIVRAWAESFAQDKVDALFGTPGKVGCVVALDAIPIKPVQLVPDVMTPHYHGWSENDPPGDWRSPVPVPFLVVEKDSLFLFALMPRRLADAALVGEAWNFLCQALLDLGAGAKTAVGYGRFEPEDSECEESHQKVKATTEAHVINESELRPVDRWQRELEGKSEEEILNLVRINLERNELKDSEERVAFAKAVVATGLVERWRKGQKNEASTKTGKDKLKQRAKLVIELANKG